jgi:hypothetical protein
MGMTLAADAYFPLITLCAIKRQKERPRGMPVDPGSHDRLVELTLSVPVADHPNRLMGRATRHPGPPAGHFMWTGRDVSGRIRCLK